MAEEITYKVIHGDPQHIENQLNELAQDGWRLATSAGLNITNHFVVVLEKKEKYLLQNSKVADEEFVGAAAAPGLAARDGGTSLAAPQPARRR